MIGQYWQNLNERERWMVAAAVTTTILYLFYLLVYSPLTAAVSSRSKQLIEKTETLRWMQDVNQQNRINKTKQTLSKGKLLSVIATQLKAQRFKQFPYQLQQTGQSDIQITFNQVPYNEVLQWLWSLNENYSLTLKQVSVDKTATPGIVKLVLVLAANAN